MSIKIGGGFYGIGTFLTFLWLEITTFIRAWQDADGIIDFIVDEFIFDFGVQSFVNGLYSMLWPFYWFGALG